MFSFLFYLAGLSPNITGSTSPFEPTCSVNDNFSELLFFFLSTKIKRYTYTRIWVISRGERVESAETKGVNRRTLRSFVVRNKTLLVLRSSNFTAGNFVTMLFRLKTKLSEVPIQFRFLYASRVPWFTTIFRIKCTKEFARTMATPYYCWASDKSLSLEQQQ